MSESHPNHREDLGLPGTVGSYPVELKVDVPINRVREMREDRLMTQAQLARKAKIALRTIHSVEKGMNCRMDTKRKILLALGLRFEDRGLVFPAASRSRDIPIIRG